jgi:hypothetical protein
METRSTTERRRYQLIVELPVDANRFGPTEVPDEIVAIENFVAEELGGEVIDVIVVIVQDLGRRLGG